MSDTASSSRNPDGFSMDTLRDVNISSQVPVGHIQFPSIEGNLKATPFTIVEREYLDQPGVSKEFIKKVCKTFFHKQRPRVILSVTGAAANYTMPPFLQQVFNRGLAKAAQSTSAWIVTGGTHAGVMKCVGEAIKKTAVKDVITIGIATFNTLSHQHSLSELLERTGADEKQQFQYAMREEGKKYTSSAVPQEFIPALLNPNHSHFILVKGRDINFGHEISFRSDFEAQVCEDYKIPLVLIVVNGGPNTLVTIQEGVKRKFPVIILEGTGRVADAVAYRVKRDRDPQRESHKDPDNPWDKMFSPDSPSTLKNEQIMKDILASKSLITLFNPLLEAEGTFDVIIFRSIFRSTNYGSFEKKLRLSIECDRVDMATELLDNAEKIQNSQAVLDSAFQFSCEEDNHAIFETLLTHGAKKETLNLSRLYGGCMPELRRRFAPVAHRHKFSTRSTGSLLSDESKDSDDDFAEDEAAGEEAVMYKEDVEFIKDVFNVVDPMFDYYSSNLSMKFDLKDQLERPVVPKKFKEVKLTDVILWAILTEKYELAKVIWRHTRLSVHSALVCFTLCQRLAGWFASDYDELTELAEFFENKAIQVIDNLPYEDSYGILTLNYDELGGVNALKMGYQSQAKNFMSHSHVQRYLEEELYCHYYGKIAPGTHFGWILLAIVFPMFIFTLYERFRKKRQLHISVAEHESIQGYDEKAPISSIFWFYTLPIVKFLTSTLFYIGFLILCSFVLIDVSDTITTAEVFLFIWIIAYLMEEVSQFRAEGVEYLKRMSNAFDMLMMAFFLTFIALRAYARDMNLPFDSSVTSASTDILMVALIISYLRILNVFSFDPKLGPLYFAILRMFGDVGRWLFIFVLFMIGFQFAFMALTIQAGNSPMALYPDGVFPISFYTIIGDWGTAVSYLGTVGLIMLSIYAIIAQIMLVNLLIAMMGDSYGNVKDNSSKEWKFSRYSLVEEFTNTSFDPPPINVFVWPLKGLYYLFQCYKVGNYEPVPDSTTGPDEEGREDLKKKMAQAMQQLLDDDDDLQKQTIVYVGDKIQAQIRDLMSEHLTDRTFLHDKFAALESRLMQSSEEKRKEGSAVNITFADGLQGKAGDSIKSLKGMHIQSIELHPDNRIGYFKLKADLLDSQNKPMSGTFIRSGFAIILLILRVEPSGQEYILMAVRRTSPATAELVTGVLDGGELCGEIPTLLEKKCGIVVKERALVDLTSLALQENEAHRAKAHAQGTAHIYLLLQSVTAKYVEELVGKLQSRTDEVFFKLVEPQDVWKHATEATELAAVLLYQSLATKIHVPAV